MKNILLIFVILFSFLVNTAIAQQKTFTIVPLGVKGGSDESNLSAYLIAPRDSSDFICLDAGTIYNGLKTARRHHLFTGSIDNFLRKNIKGYLISHGHLDHVAGLIINSPEDSKKNIYALSFCIKVLKTKYFTWTSWANFGNEGERPTLKKYTYKYLHVGNEMAIDNTPMFVTPYLLSHAVPGRSTAFLIRFGDNYFLYLGDTGDDANEQSDDLKNLWKTVAPLVTAQKLKGISIECSYPDEQPNDRLYGHLKPRLLIKNLNILDSLAGKNSLEKMPIIVAHMKPAGDNETTIRDELAKENYLGVDFIFPKQGKKIVL
ncbi:3',5'-cyclic-nucleotide phosphodiesterase [Arachidicoccus sp.]|uniref:3',5'-cyclic-nucleotide phosphodiesterase n=1 Tax=Arachidicoccus sp. TaxID=1872624 RepID=UPI003D1B5212